MRSAGHASTRLLHRYAAGEPGIGSDQLWALEAHLESCGVCRERVGAAVTPETAAVLDRVRIGLDAELACEPRVPARRRWRWARSARWATPTLLPWLGMTVLVVLTALGFDLAAEAAGGRLPSLVLLLAPVAPLLGVAAAWTQGRDPAHELVTATPRAGLYLAFRRTLAVLAVVIPALGAAGWVVGASPARWLLPALAFTATALALGPAFGLPRAAGGLAGVWAAVVVAPSLVTAQAPAVLEPATLPGWAGCTALALAVLAVRRRAYTRLGSAR